MSVCVCVRARAIVCEFARAQACVCVCVCVTMLCINNLFYAIDLCALFYVLQLFVFKPSRKRSESVLRARYSINSLVLLSILCSGAGGRTLTTQGVSGVTNIGRGLVNSVMGWRTERVGQWAHTNTNGCTGCTTFGAVPPP